VQREDVQGELKITESQIEKIESLAGEQRESMRDQFGQFGDFQNMSDEERQDAMAKMRERRTASEEPQADWEILKSAANPAGHLSSAQPPRVICGGVEPRAV
jgi:hypothetical protein